MGKFYRGGAPNPNNKVKDAVKTGEATNKNGVNKVNTKKAKKNKIPEIPLVIPAETRNDNGISTPKKAKKNKNKNKILENSAEKENGDVEAKVKKMKFVEMSNETSESDLGKPKAKKSKKNSKPEEQNENEEDSETVAKVKTNEVETSGGAGKEFTEEMITRYPVLKDEEVIKKFQSVTVSNNQKGRIRQQFKQQLKGTSEAMLPDAINTKMQAVIKGNDPNWMKVRILFNMLTRALQGTVTPVKKEKKKKEKKEQKQKPQKENGTEEKPEQKVKGPKRYVVFIGNLGLDISKEKILEHFADLSDKIKDVRIPNPLENRKSRIAYVEVADEVTYELALSKHHTMLDNKRINVMYSTQKDSKVSKTEAKGKAAKLVAMQKSGQLTGSVPLSKKRSARRNKMKQAQKVAQEAAERGV